MQDLSALKAPLLNLLCQVLVFKEHIADFRLNLVRQSVISTVTWRDGLDAEVLAQLNDVSQVMSSVGL